MLYQIRVHGTRRFTTVLVSYQQQFVDKAFRFIIGKFNAFTPEVQKKNFKTCIEHLNDTCEISSQ